MKKKLLSIMMAAVMVVGMTACGNDSSSSGGTSNSNNSADSGEKKEEEAPKQEEDTGPVKLVLWGAEEDQDYLKTRVEEFKKAYPDKQFEIEIGVESESTAKDTILTDIEAAADVFSFADDQLPDLVDAGALLELDDNMSQVLQTYAGKSLDDVKAANVPVSVSDATFNDKLYAFPSSADNGYFLYYDSSVLSEDDVKTWKGLLDAVKSKGKGKKVGMTLASGWYNAGFFYGAGFTTGRNEDGTTTIDWNGTSPDGVSGVSVVKAMLEIAAHPSFMAVADGDISNQIASKKLCAVVSGTWDATAVSKVFKDGYAATVLPTYEADGQEVHTGSVTGCKLEGVNAHSKNAGWAVLLADFLTNEESQTAHFVEREVGPSNINAQNSEDVKKNLAISAVLAQNEYAVIQKVGGKFWHPAGTFGENVAQGKIKSDDSSIQKALDDLVEGVTAPVS